MKKTVFTGSGVAIITPFNETGIDFEKLGELIDFQIENHTDAIIICGTTGESSTMPDAEHLSAVEYTVKKTAGRVPVIAGTGSNDTAHGIELSKEAQRLGADALLQVTPYYNKATQKGLLLHYTALADAVDIPLILYNVPSRTGVNLSVGTIKELAKHPNITAIKEASGNIAFAAQVMAACGGDIDMYSGNDDMIVPILSLGGKGVISVIANIIPKETHELCAAFLEGRIEESRKLQLEMMDLAGALFCEVNPIPVKTAMNLLGYNVGSLRLPLCEMEPANLERLQTALKNYGLL